MKKLLYILTRFPVPTETFILNELRQVRREGIDYDLFAFHVDTEKASLPPYLEIKARELLGAHTIRGQAAFMELSTKKTGLMIKIAKERWCKKFHHLIQAAWLAKWCIDNNIGHIHAHYAYHSTSAARVISALTGISYSFTAHANDIFKSSWQMGEKIRDSLFCATCTGYNREYLLNTYKDIKQEKVHRIYHGIDTTLFLRSEKPSTREQTDSLKTVTVARLREKKGIDYLIEALALLRSKGIPVIGKIIGSGPDESRLQQLAIRHGIEKYITFTGSLPHEDVKDALDKADLFVLPSIIAPDGSRDGIPNVILEAMAMELPVVSTRVSAIPEAVSHGKTGILVPPKDSKSLADAIEQLYLEPQKRSLMGQEGRNRVKTLFDLERNTQLLIHQFSMRLRSNPSHKSFSF